MSKFGFAGLLLIGFACAGMLNGAGAEQVLQSSDDFLQMTMTTGFDTGRPHYGDAFEGVLNESYRYEDKEIPAGTILKGHVNRVHHSYSFALPGYAVFNVEEAVLPSGERREFAQDAAESRKVMHPKAKTHKKLIKSAIPFSLVSMSDALPLKLATSLTPMQIAPISLAARVVLGTALEATKKEKEWHEEKDHPVQTRIGHGVLRGTGLTGAYYFIHPSPEPNLKTGAVVPLRFKKEELADLFKAVNHTTAEAKPVELEPIENEGQGFGQVYGKFPQTQPAQTSDTPAQ